MLIENNWISTNIKEKAANNDLDFKVTINPYPYQKMSFSEASDAVANKIAALNKPIYIGYSGGIDSEYVVKTFMKNNIPFKTVTVDVGGNKLDLEYVNRFLYEFPTIVNEKIKIVPKQFVKKTIDIYKKYNVLVIGSVSPLEAANYVKQQGGILVVGDHLIGENNKTNGDLSIQLNEWDFYYDFFVGDDLVVPFFTYDLSIAESYISKLDNTKVEYFKEKLYSIPFRPKFYTNFINNKINKVFNQIQIKSKSSGKKTFITTKKIFLNKIG